MQCLLGNAMPGAWQLLKHCSVGGKWVQWAESCRCSASLSHLSHPFIRSWLGRVLAYQADAPPAHSAATEEAFVTLHYNTSHMKTHSSQPA